MIIQNFDFFAELTLKPIFAFIHPKGVRALLLDKLHKRVYYQTITRLNKKSNYCILGLYSLVHRNIIHLLFKFIVFWIGHWQIDTTLNHSFNYVDNLPLGLVSVRFH